MPFLLRSREMFWVSRGGWVPPLRNSACGEGGSHPSGPWVGRGTPALRLPGESTAAPGAREGKESWRRREDRCRGQAQAGWREGSV